MRHSADSMTEVCGTFFTKIPVGTKLYFPNEKQGYTVRASNRFYSICTKPFNARKTVLYTIIDWKNNIRGTENMIFGLGAETDEQCEKMLERLTDGESDISQRNSCKLSIEKIKTIK